MFLKLNVIRTPSKVYLTTNLTNNDYDRKYGTTKLLSYLFDGKKPKTTYLNDFVEVAKIPTTITNEIIPRKKVIRYKLKNGYTVSDLMPEIISVDDDSYEDIMGLYVAEYDNPIAIIENVDFEINIIHESDFDVETKLIDKVSYPIINQLSYHKSLLPFTETNLAGLELYNFLFTNIKALITSNNVVVKDYTCTKCFSKNIELYRTKTYFTNEKKPKLITKNTRSIDILNLEIKNDRCFANGSELIIKGKNINDLNDQLDLYIKNITDKLNEEIVECSHCGGVGCLKLSEKETGIQK